MCVANSVDQIEQFLCYCQQKFLTKVVQIFGDFWGL